MVVSGLTGLYRLVANRHNGLVVEDLESGSKRFCSVRKHQFTPLGSVAIFTQADSASLSEIFGNISKLGEGISLPKNKSSDEEVRSFFELALPEYDPDRVYLSDMKKVIKWYTHLKENNLLDELASDSKEEEE